MTKQTLDEVFNLPEKPIDQPKTVMVKSSEQDAETDYHYTRNNLYAILDQGQEALATALAIAKQSEHPRAFEVVGNLMKNLADINKQLFDLTEKHHNAKNTDMNHDNTFIGATVSLNKLIHNTISQDFFHNND